MDLEVDLGVACHVANLPSMKNFSTWVKAAAKSEFNKCSISIKIIDENESKALNKQWRNKSYPTNVLSFPANMNEQSPYLFLGDLALCASIIQHEANEQSKPLLAHWAHMVIHGTLHLIGYDHLKEEDAIVMETLETDIMKQLGYNNPYI